MTAIRKLSQDEFAGVQLKATTAKLLIREVANSLGLNLENLVQNLDTEVSLAITSEVLNPGLSELDRNDQEHLGRKIAEARKEAGKTQIELSKALNITQGQMSKYETGTAATPQEVILKISEICNKPYDWFFE